MDAVNKPAMATHSAAVYHRVIENRIGEATRAIGVSIPPPTPPPTASRESGNRELYTFDEVQHVDGIISSGHDDDNAQRKSLIGAVASEGVSTAQTTPRDTTDVQKQQQQSALVESHEVPLLRGPDHDASKLRQKGIERGAVDDDDVREAKEESVAEDKASVRHAMMLSPSSMSPSSSCVD